MCYPYSTRSEHIPCSSIVPWSTKQLSFRRRTITTDEQPSRVPSADNHIMDEFILFLDSDKCIFRTLSGYAASRIGLFLPTVRIRDRNDAGLRPRKTCVRATTSHLELGFDKNKYHDPLSIVQLEGKVLFGLERKRTRFQLISTASVPGWFQHFPKPIVSRLPWSVVLLLVPHQNDTRPIHHPKKTQVFRMNLRLHNTIGSIK